MDMAVDQASPGNRLRSRLKRKAGRASAAWGSLGSWGLRSLTNLSDAKQRETLVRRRYGCIVTAGGELVAVHGRWWPYRGSLMRVAWDARYASLPVDECELYFHQPAASSSYLTLSYVHSGDGTSLTTFYAACLALDEVARLKRVDAIVCHVTNGRISDRLFERWGWQPHCLKWRGRHYIKRFYGCYPELSANWRRRLTLEPAGAQGDHTA
jgi:hypothetical protein